MPKIDGPLDLDVRHNVLLAIAVKQTIHPALHFDGIERYYETRSYARVAQSTGPGQASRNSAR